MVDYSDEFERHYINFEKLLESASSYEEAGLWIKLAQHPNYPTFNECKHALISLLASKDWTDIRSDEGCSCCVLDLGVGSGEKLFLISRDIGSANLIPLDISKPMLKIAYQRIRQEQQALGLNTPVIPMCVNFLTHLKGITADERARTYLGNRKFLFILGSTFGNYDESVLLTQFREFMCADDVLIIGAEFFQLADNSTQDVEKSRSFAWFTSEPYYAYWRNPMINPQYHAAPMHTCVNYGGGHSRIKDSIAIQTIAEDTEIPLLQSTRYHEANFLEYMRRFGFEYRFSVASPQNPFYKHLVFRLSGA